jgi:HK97 family phage major capsid protein
MKRDINAMKRELDALTTEARAILDAAETRSDKTFSKEEESRYAEVEKKMDTLAESIKREQKLIDIDQTFAGKNAPAVIVDPKSEEYRSFGDFLQDVRFNPNSERLQTRDVSMGNGPSAGFLVPTAFDNTIRQIEAPAGIVRPRALVLPSESASPDAALDLISLDQSGQLGVYSGVVVRWTGEQQAPQDAGDPRVRKIKLEPQQVTGFIDVTDKLLRNSTAAGTMVQRLLTSAILGAEDDCFYNGDGVAKPAGIIGSNAAINVPRTAANSIRYADVVAMYSVSLGTQLVWVASRSTLPQLMSMVDAGNNLVWQPNAREGAPGTLLGIPVILNDQAPVLGSEGDLALCDMSYYGIKDGSPLAIFIDPYTQKGNGATRIYAFWNVDGQPLLTSPLLGRDGVSQSSPFVVLQ